MKEFEVTCSHNVSMIFKGKIKGETQEEALEKFNDYPFSCLDDLEQIDEITNGVDLIKIEEYE